MDFETKTNDRLKTTDLGQSNDPPTMETSPPTINGSSKDRAEGGELEVAKSEQSLVSAVDVPSTPPALDIQQAATQGMQFLATAPPEVLGGLLVSLAISRVLLPWLLTRGGKVGATAVLYMIFGSLALFIAGTMFGIVVHSSWETHQRRKNWRDDIFAWKATKEKGAEDDLEIPKVSDPASFNMYANS